MHNLTGKDNSVLSGCAVIPQLRALVVTNLPAVVRVEKIARHRRYSKISGKKRVAAGEICLRVPTADYFGRHASAIKWINGSSARFAEQPLSSNAVHFFKAARYGNVSRPIDL